MLCKYVVLIASFKAWKLFIINLVSVTFFKLSNIERRGTFWFLDKNIVLMKEMTKSVLNWNFNYNNYHHKGKNNVSIFIMWFIFYFTKKTLL